MFLLSLFAFVSGIVTILSPCILPILPIVLSGTLSGGKKKPIGIVAGFILSFTFFTLFLTTIIKLTGVSAYLLRTISVFIIGIFGISLVMPKFQVATEKLFSRLVTLAPQHKIDSNRPDFIAGFFIGLSLGLIWTPCVGPILASIITLAATNTINGGAIFITLMYSVGTAIPLFAITYGGRQLLTNHPWLSTHTVSIQKTFGILMILAAISIFLSWDRQFQSYILTTFPNYGTGLTKIEDNAFVKNALQTVKKSSTLSLDAPELITDGKWFNSKPLTLQSLRGNVVLLDFWTYTCINCIRTLPYLKSWWKKYGNKGLVIIGIHTPEFEFEKNPNNVEQAIKDFGITYPVMQDNAYATWQAYSNQYWPAHYLIDKDGKIRDTHFGEGAYDETEKKIQELLNVDMPINNPTYQVRTQTPETYLGSKREGSGFTLGGTWTSSEEYAMPTSNSILTFPFYAANVYLVMRPKNHSGKIEVYLDGTLQKEITVDLDKLYTLIELPVPGQHELRLKFLDENLELYAFTFG